MAACNLGSLYVNISTLDCALRKSGILRLNGLRTWSGKKSLDSAGLRISRVPRKVLNVSTGPSLETLPVLSPENESEEPEISGLRSHVVPNSDEVEYLLTRICDTTSVAEFELKVGFFRRSRTIKGKRAPPPCKEKQTVKEGQVICYIEQLGGELPIESDVSGEVIKILRQDGDPVGYNDALIAILPSFPGIKKLQ
ncbi:uncharacterized protein LOC133796352 isoform X2 [Humulus lupulus]|uniref:uncharacterized protein LOC133796352 isoform X2 n=1 Tax=Humulus lupulus TaxID=3486 RepID=UPI002B40DA39|nr:uncharacterized protein LOC133796352 isoform X2 [Humulus lupulus]